MSKTATGIAEAKQPSAILHVFYGHSRSRLKSRPKCEGSEQLSKRHVARPVEIARTYFGMQLCRGCWDDWWRSEGMEGMPDPAFDAIHHEHNGEWLA